MKNIRPLHRDDVPMDVAEGVVEAIKKKHPECTVRFAGDLPEAEQKKLADQVAAIEELHMQSFCNGTCIDCGCKMPSFPANDDPMPDDWQPSAGWSWFSQGEEGTDSYRIVAWQCPECDAKASLGEGEPLE